MPRVVLDGSYETWHRAARGLLERDQPPAAVEWVDAQSAQSSLDGLTSEPVTDPSARRAIAVPRAFVGQAKLAACHRDPSRWALLYAVVWRLTHGERALLADALDRDVRRLTEMVGQVRRDEHRMHAFVRFR